MFTVKLMTDKYNQHIQEGDDAYVKQYSKNSNLFYF